jgi:hypothetical protein
MLPNPSKLERPVRIYIYFWNTAHIVHLKGNVSTSFLTSFVNRQLSHSKRIYVSPIFKTVHYILDLQHAVVLRNTITTISIHILLRTKKKLLQSYLLIRYQSIGRKCNGQYETRNTSVSISGAFAQSRNVPSSFFTAMIPSAYISVAPTLTDWREIWQCGLKITGTYVKTMYDGISKNISGANHNATLYVRCLSRLY